MTEIHGVREYLQWTVDAKKHLRSNDDLFQMPKDFVYFGIEDLVLRHGRSFTPQPLPKKYRRMPPKHCFDNVYRLCKRYKTLRYVEGYAESIITMHHAWAIDQDDKVVDPTWETPGKDYFGVVVPMHRLEAVRSENNCSFFDQWENGFKVLREPWKDGE